MADARTWRQKRKTLGDEAIFGPVHDFACCCGKYRGTQYEGMICDWCGVKIASSTIRRSRFGHIELPTVIRHPLAAEPSLLSALPVLPAAFWESVQGAKLPDLYEEVLRACGSPRADATASAVAAVFEAICPIAVEAYRWNLQDASTLLHGLALIEREP
jgi:hypothetical protein